MRYVVLYQPFHNAPWEVVSERDPQDPSRIEKVLFRDEREAWKRAFDLRDALGPEGFAQVAVLTGE